MQSIHNFVRRHHILGSIITVAVFWLVMILASLSLAVVFPNLAQKESYVLQAMAEASREYVRPAYYDLVLVSKNLRDDESAAMLDVIFGSFVLDPTDLYSWSGLTSNINAAFFDGDLASLIASEKSKFQEAINKTADAFK